MLCKYKPQATTEGKGMIIEENNKAPSQFPCSTYLAFLYNDFQSAEIIGMGICTVVKVAAPQPLQSSPPLFSCPLCNLDPPLSPAIHLPLSSCTHTHTCVRRDHEGHAGLPVCCRVFILRFPQLPVFIQPVLRNGILHAANHARYLQHAGRCNVPKLMDYITSYIQLVAAANI